METTINPTMLLSTGRVRPKLTLSYTEMAANSDAKISLENELPAGLIRERIPKHVAVIMDGNRRWAKKNGLPPKSGHTAMVPRLMEVVGLCCTWGIRVLTVYAFSTENWTRPQMEMDFLKGLFERMLQEHEENFMRNEVRVSIIGNPIKLPVSLQDQITKTTDTTKKNSKVHLLLAINYGGRDDILQACRNISHKVKDGLVKPEDVNESLFNNELGTSNTEFPYPDLLIRTSGEFPYHSDITLSRQVQYWHEYLLGARRFIV